MSAASLNTSAEPQHIRVAAPTPRASRRRVYEDILPTTGELPCFIDEDLAGADGEAALSLAPRELTMIHYGREPDAHHA